MVSKLWAWFPTIWNSHKLEACARCSGDGYTACLHMEGRDRHGRSSYFLECGRCGGTGVEPMFVPANS